MKKIIVDMFGADRGPEVVVRGAARALMSQTEYDIVLSGSSLIAQIVLQEEATRVGMDPAELISRVSVIETNSFVTNNDSPSLMVKDRNDSSMVLAMKALKSDSEIAAMVTAGSTGCALVGCCFHVGLEKNLLRPVLGSALPKKGGGFVILLDCGSNLEPKLKDMESYARLGAKLATESYGADVARVGLVNVGSEKGKGTDLQKEAYERISAAAEKNGFRFVGNIEGGDILSGSVDVAVCDGFTGNVLLKTLESAGLIAAEMAQEAETQQAGEADEEPLNKEGTASFRIRRFFDYNSQAGAIFLGTEKTVIKAHGAATEDTICSCIHQAIRLTAK